MARDASPPVPLTTVGPSKGATVVFRLAGKLHVTAVLKATFAFVPGAPMKVIEPEDLFRVELHHRDNPMRSIRATSDVVPYLPRVDVVLTGHARAPTGRTVTTQVVRLAIYHGHALLDKTLHVHGDRKANDLVPFDKMPLVYERAIGGIGFRQNPLGTGKAAGTPPPNIIHPVDPEIVAGFGPISRALPQRKSLLGSLTASALDQPVPELPAEFDWSYFQCAPPDQQLPSLQGNEWIVLDGMHHEHARGSSRLPTVRPLVVVFGLDPRQPDAPRTIVLRPDLLRIDADNFRCSLISRVVIPLEDERALSTLRLVGGVETEGAPIAHLLTPPPPREHEVARAAIVDEKTAALPEEDDGSIDVDLSTFIIEDAEEEEPEHQFAGTYALAPEDAIAAERKPATPFDAGNKPIPPPRPSNLPIPGAPWSGAPANAAVLPYVDEVTRAMKFTIELNPLESDLVPAAAPPPPPPDSTRNITPPPMIDPPPAAAPPPIVTLPAEVAPIPPAPPSAPDKPELNSPKTWSWAESPPEPKVEVPKPPPPRVPPKPGVNKTIYGGFGPAKKK